MCYVELEGWTYHDGHWVGGQVQAPVTGCTHHDPLLSGESGGDGGPAIGRAKAGMGEEGWDQHAPPGAGEKGKRAPVSSTFWLCHPCIGTKPPLNQASPPFMIFTPSGENPGI